MKCQWNGYEFLDGNLLKYMDALGSQVNSGGLDSVSSYYRECMRKAVRHRSPREFCRCICDLAPPGTVGRSGRNCEQSCIKCMTDVTRGPCQCLCEEFTESIRDVGKCNRASNDAESPLKTCATRYPMLQPCGQRVGFGGGLDSQVLPSSRTHPEYPESGQRDNE
jgi:hypothetical protein